MEKENIEIIVIEDEEDILELIEYYLSKEGYSVTGFLSTQNVERFIEEESPSLMIMDRNLPTMEGSDFVKYIRDLGYDIPVIFLTAKDRDIDLEEGFLKGGDDYMTKPFNPKELMFRVKAILKRSGILSNSHKIKYRDMVLDIHNHSLSIDNSMVELTNLEFKLLHTFVKNPRQPLDREFLKDEVWGDDSLDVNDKTINVAMNRLKKKIDPSGKKEYILPVWGIGYKLI